MYNIQVSLKLLLNVTIMLNEYVIKITIIVMCNIINKRTYVISPLIVLISAIVTKANSLVKLLYISFLRTRNSVPINP